MTTMMVSDGGPFGGGRLVVSRGSLSPPGPELSPGGRLPSPQPPLSPASSGELPTSPVSPGRHGGNKACGVCGDIAKSMHFGGLSCDSCKAFFRRSVQNSAYKGFTCPYEKKCVIGVSSRKACQYCRFQKCLTIGMEKGWVMTEDERRKMMQQRQDRKSKPVKGQEPKDMDMYTLTEEDSQEIELIVSLYRRAYQAIPYDEKINPEGASGVMSPWMTFCKRIGYYFSLFKEFADLPSPDQALLLKTAITSACIIMGSVVYDSSTGQWPTKGVKRTGFVPSVSTSNVKSLVPPELMSRVEQFFKKFQLICPDETMAMILILVTLYSPELMGLQARDEIQALQERYTHILHSYVRWKYKEKSHLMFPKVLVSLADIRELAERTLQMRIQQGATSGMSLSSIMPRRNSKPEASSAAVPMETCQSDVVAEQESVFVKEEHDDDDDVKTHGLSHKRHLDCSEGVASRNPTYQKILQKVMDQMHSTTLNMRAPQLLPFIIQIVKKIGSENCSGVNVPLNNIAKIKQHRSGTKRRQVEIKKEQIDDDSSAHISQEFSASDMPEEMILGMQTDAPDYSHNQKMQQEHHLPQTPMLHTEPQFPAAHSHFNTANLYPASPMDSVDSCDVLPPSPFHTNNAVTTSMMTSPHHTPVMRCSSQSLHMAPVAPYTPPFVATSPMPVQQSDMLLPSPMAAPSPYSDTSSSSPPESSQSPLSELFTADLTEVEVDVITQLLDYVCNNSNLDNLNSLKEIIPQHLLAELQSKLA